MPAIVSALVLLAGACSGSGNGAPGPASTTAASSNDPVIGAAGDIACNSFPSEHNRRCKYNHVADLLQNVDKFLALGDLQYLHGSLEGFQTYYGKYFGKYKDITAPAPGNHETYTSNMKGYLKYFGLGLQSRYGLTSKWGFYSFNLGGWHIISLSSQLCKGSTWNPETGQGAQIVNNASVSRGCGPGTPEYEWLKHDLATHPNSQYPCTLAYWHHPRFIWSPWPPGPMIFALTPLWEELYNAHADVILNGHYHNYQRFAPQDPQGDADPNGITEFIVGTGGDTYENDMQGTPPPNLESSQATSFGILEMTLQPSSYDFRFVPAAGERPFSDSGHAECH